MEKFSLLGVRVDRITSEETLELIDRYVAEHKPHHIVTADASMIVMAREDPALAEIMLDADVVTADGAGILWASRRLGIPIASRVSGVDLVERICERSASTGMRVFFLGAAPGVADEAAENLRAKYPGAQIVGTRNGFFSESEEFGVVTAVTNAHPDVLLVAFGIPKQEIFIKKYRDVFGASVLIGIGGSFDIYSGRVKRAPAWMQSTGLEWLYRLYQNPKKIGKVMMLPRFVLTTIFARRARLL